MSVIFRHIVGMAQLLQKLILYPDHSGETELWSGTNVAACERSKVDANNSS